METRDIVINNVKVGELSLPDGTSEAVWAEKLAAYQPKPKTFAPIRPMYIRMALEELNILDSIEAALEAPEMKLKKIAWEFALEYHRDNSMVNEFAAAFGLSSSQLDDLFDRAAVLQEEYK